jgi:transposase
VQTVGEDGYALLDALDAAEAPEGLRELPRIATLRQTWDHHYERRTEKTTGAGQPAASRVRFKTKQELPQAAEEIQSPYDPDARYRHKRETSWVGYMVHVSETCEPTTPHLLTHVHTTTAAVHEAMCTADIHQALVDKDVAPGEHWVDAAYIDADLLVRSQEDHGITLRGPARPNPTWQATVAGAYTVTDFTVDWEHQQVHCPQGKASASWTERLDHTGTACIQVRFS